MKADHPEDIEDIKELIAQTENEQVEFKETTGQLEPWHGNALCFS